MRPYIFFIVFLLLIPNFCFAQIDYEKRAKEYFKVRNYERALKDYTRAIKKDPENEDILEKMILCYFNSNSDRSEALPLIEQLEKLNPDHKELNFYYARAAFHANQFDKAFDYLENYRNNNSLSSEVESEVDMLGNNILNAQALVKKPVDITFINLGESINTSRSEINPFVTQDDQVLFLGSDKKYLSDFSINCYNVCISLKQDSVWGDRKYISSRVNTMYDEIPAGLSQDGKLLFVFHNKYQDQTLASVEYKGNYSFDYLMDLGQPINSNGDEYGACLTADGDTLYMAIEMEDGQSDILYSIKLPNGGWGEPRLIPGLINTDYDENFPNISEDGNKMIFSSNGKSSMGGYDLFYSIKNIRTGEWGEPVNLGYPINDTYDNFTISRPQNKRYAYISTVRYDSYGLRDIYKIVYNKEEAPNVIYKYQIKNEDGSIIKGIKPKILLWNQNHSEIVGDYTCSPQTGKFVVAVTPGKYLLEIWDDETQKYHETIVFDEKNDYSSIIQKEIIIKN